MRLHFDKGIGAAREIHAGSGYWSQDSAVAVLSIPEPPRHISVLWPGGKTIKAAVPALAREIAVDYDGNVKLIR